MRQFTIDIYNNRTKKIVREAIKFEGDLQTVRKFALSLAKRLKLADGTAYIYDRNGYRKGDLHITKVNYQNLQR
jgi:hypothetical protein